jgi:hypothetical protein
MTIKKRPPLNKWFDSKLKIESQEALMTLNSSFEETLKEILKQLKCNGNRKWRLLFFQTFTY